MNNALSTDEGRWLSPAGVALVVAATLAYGCCAPAYLRPHAGRHGHHVYFPDFFQDWYSARCWWEGRSPYAPLRPGAQRYLGVGQGPDDLEMIEVNAHPPSSVLLSLPFGLLSFPTAFAAWNLLSLLALAASIILTWGTLRPRIPKWAVLALVAGAGLSYPLRQNLVHGQSGLFLLLLMTAAWRADRSGRAWRAGTLIGVAAVIKLFPAYLVAYFLLAGRWRAAVAGAASAAVLTGVTAVVLGPGTFTVYAGEVLPVTSRFATAWSNLSLTGLWLKLFDQATVFDGLLVEPLLQSRGTAWALVLVSAAILTAAAVRLAWRERATGPADGSFAAALVIMVLISPVTWGHYFVLLLMPVVYLWTMTTAGPRRWLFLTAVLDLCAGPLMLKAIFLTVLGAGPDPAGTGWVSLPWGLTLASSLPTYALLTLFILLLTSATSAPAATGEAAEGLAADVPAVAARVGSSSPGRPRLEAEPGLPAGAER